MRLYLLIALLLISMACEEMTVGLDSVKDVFTIEKGSHKSLYALKPFSGDKISFVATFDETAVYETKNPDNQADINKLMGFSDCGSTQHYNSARFGWRWFNEELQIFSYIYDNGTRQYNLITSVPLFQENQFSIVKEKEGYLFKVNNNKLKVPHSRSKCKEGKNYVLWPYFGGDEAAPHDIKILIEQIETEPVDSVQ